MDQAVLAFWLPKLGNDPEEYEDAFAWSAENHHFAIADGATESSFAERWAQSLVREYISNPPAIAPGFTTPMAQWLAPLQQAWHDGIPWDRLPWYAEEKARNGAFATFLGLRFNPPQQRSWLQRLFAPRQGSESAFRWRAVAIGDSCLFQVRDGALLRSFPLNRASEFNSRPLLVSSNAARNRQIWPEFKFADGDCRTGDVFILATDAIACWFLKEAEAGGRPWTQLSQLKLPADFSTFVEALRKKGAMRNDDTTLLIFSWSDSVGPISTGRNPARTLTKEHA